LSSIECVTGSSRREREGKNARPPTTNKRELDVKYREVEGKAGLNAMVIQIKKKPEKKREAKHTPRSKKTWD